MFDHFDIKSIFLGSLLGLVVGGGVFGLYFKRVAPAAFSEVSTYELLGRCVAYTSNKALIHIKREEIELFLKSVNQKLPDIYKADAVVTTVAATAGERSLPAGMGGPLQMCVNDLRKGLEKASK